MEGIMNWWADFAETFEKCFIKDDRYMLLLDGIGVTIKISVLAVMLGIAIGLVIAFCNLSKNKLCNVVVVNPNGTMTAVIVNGEKEDIVCKMVMGEQVMEVNAPARSTITITWEASIK
jgi:hypothetical protein